MTIDVLAAGRSTATALKSRKDRARRGQNAALPGDRFHRHIVLAEEHPINGLGEHSVILDEKESHGNTGYSRPSGGG